MRTLISLLVFLGLVVAAFEYGYGPSRPKYIFAHGMYYRIYYSRTEPLDMSKERDEREAKDDTIGEVEGLVVCSPDASKRFIQIDPYEPLEDMQDTIWHEAKHAANDCADNPPSTYDDLFEIQNPEELKLLKNNPQLLKFITAEKVSWLK